MKYIEIENSKKEIIKNNKNHRTRNRAMAIKMNIEHKVSIRTYLKIL